MADDDKIYRIPVCPSIGSGNATGKRVYKTEAKITELVERLGKDIAALWTEHTGEENARLYQGQIPEALAAVLSRYESKSSLAAVIGWCLSDDGPEGVVVTRAMPPDLSGNITITIPVALAKLMRDALGRI